MEIIAAVYAVVCTATVLLWTRWDDFETVSGVIRDNEQFFDHKVLSGRRNADQRRLIRKEVRQWLRDDASIAFSSMKAIAMTLALAFALYVFAALMLTGIQVAGGTSTDLFGDAVHNSGALLASVVDKATFEVFSSFGELPSISTDHWTERLILFSLSLSFVFLASKVVTLVLQNVVTLVVLNALPLSTLRAAKGVRQKRKRAKEKLWIRIAGFVANIYRR